MAVNTNSQAIYNDDVLGLTGMNIDDFPVEDLFNLDFPELETCFSQVNEERVNLEKDFHHFSPKAYEFDAISAGQLPLQINDLEDLGWLSQFVDSAHNDNRSEPSVIPVPKKARSKRSRPHGRPWYMDQKIKSETNGGPLSGRKCSHCQVQRTPQWRTGPLGPKTLCNACGVRFNSGRLYPEYRPACSPTFSHDLHSNSHRKVLEMRRKREMTRGS
ncbi:hypothetical protein ACS0TY_001666 [Phlomoides rotata]